VAIERRSFSFGDLGGVNLNPENQEGFGEAKSSLSNRIGGDIPEGDLRSKANRLGSYMATF